jgi:hypothetical protein
MVRGWRANAHEPLTADDYRASVGKFLEVSVDARLYRPHMGDISLEDDDEPGQL